MKVTNPVHEGLLNIHRIITRGLKTSISKCDEYQNNLSITPGETTGLSMYLTTLKMVMHSHHLSEDEIAFPYFKNKIEAPFDQLEDDHREMAKLLDDLEKCIPDLSNDGIRKTLDVLKKLNDLWLPHIRIEENNFTVEIIQSVTDFKEQADIAKRLRAHSMKNSGPGPQTVPFLIYNLEGRDREIFIMNFPWIVNKFLVPFVWKGKWKPMSEFLIQ